jgi:hypothetical protein
VLSALVSAVLESRKRRDAANVNAVTTSSVINNTGQKTLRRFFVMMLSLKMSASKQINTLIGQTSTAKTKCLDGPKIEIRVHCPYNLRNRLA